MKQLLSGLAAHGKPSGPVRARFQSMLYILANAQIFFLDSITYLNRLLVVLPAGFADIAEIKVENDFAMVGIDRDNEVGVHVSLVAVDHQVGIMPEIPGAVAFARGAGRHTLDQATEEVVQRSRTFVQIDKHKAFPRLHANRD